jgi:hypothetical protein
MDGEIGQYTEIDSYVSELPDIQDGDIFEAEVVGSTINAYLNGQKIRTATDSTYATGQPGVGFFWRGTENASDFAFPSLTVTALP